MPRYHAAAETPRGEAARNETGASSAVAPPFSFSTRRHLQTRASPRSSTETTAPVSSHARTSVTVSPSACPRNAAARAKVTRDPAFASREARSTSRARAPASGDAITARSGGGSPRGLRRPWSDSAPVGFAAAPLRDAREAQSPSPRVLAQVTEKYDGDAAASRARGAARPSPSRSSSSIGARRQRCARGTAAAASNPSSIHTHTAPSDPSAARKSAPSRAGTAAAPNPKSRARDEETASSSRVRETFSSFVGVSGGGGAALPALSSRSHLRAPRGSGRHASQCASSSAGPYPEGPGSVCTTTVCTRRGRSVAPPSAADAAVHTRAAPSSVVVTSATSRRGKKLPRALPPLARVRASARS